MAKRILQFGMMLCLLGFVFGATAQEETKEKARVQDYPRMGFWSNWSIGADFGANYQISLSSAATPGYWGLGAHLFFQKKVSPLWNLRLALGFPRFVSFQGKAEDAEADVYGTATADFLWSIINGFSYNPDRKVDLQWLGGAGIAFENNPSQNGHVTLYARTGLEFDWYICEHSTLFLDALVGMTDIPAPKAWFYGAPRGKCNTYLGIGYMYNFGLTKADKELLAQREMLDNNPCEDLNNQINDLASELADCKQNERKLENKIKDLENELDMCRNGENEKSKELQQRIDQMKNDQLTYYALPFSITYDVNQSKVNANEMPKLKAIAQVMESDPDLKLNVVGFCDATGSDDYNMKLSQKRAETARDILVKKYGINKDRLSCDWKGKSMAFGDSKLSINRRVSFYRMID